MKIPFPIRVIPNLALKAWFTPPPLSSRTRERDAEALRGLTPLAIEGQTGFEVGAGPLVLALHGWGGRAAQMAPIARRLASRGYRVIAADLPSGAGKTRTDLKEVAEVVRAVIEVIGTPQAVIGHSFAAMVMRLAFERETPPVAVLMAPSLSASDALEVFADRARLFPWVVRGLRSGLESWDPDLWPLLSQLTPEQLPGSDVLILHDPDDEDTPFAASAVLAARRPDTALVALPGTGHAGILSDPIALDLVAEFLNERISALDPAETSIGA